MMKTSVRARYEAEKSSASATLTLKAGDVNLRASMTDATVVNGPSLNGLGLSIDKPGSFIINYDVPKKVPIPPLFTILPLSSLSPQFLGFVLFFFFFLFRMLGFSS